MNKEIKMTLEQLLDDTFVNWQGTWWGNIDIDGMTDREKKMIKEQVLKVKSTLRGSTGAYFKVRGEYGK